MGYILTDYVAMVNFNANQDELEFIYTQIMMQIKYDYEKSFTVDLK